MAKHRTPQPAPPPVAKNRTPHPAPPPASRNRTPQPGKAVTEAAVRPKVDKVDTEPALTTVHMPSRSKETEPDGQGALERRPAKPSGPTRRPPPSRP
jgi:hypothetical protein